MAAITIRKLEAGSPELMAAAQWRYDAFLKDDGYTLEVSAAQLEKLATAPEGCETALIASVDGTPAGVCLLVLHELPPAHDLSPWLASLYVVPEFRGRGLARQLIGAIEEHARGQGISRVHLYTHEAEQLYVKCGWRVEERMQTRFGPFALMVRDV